MQDRSFQITCKITYKYISSSWSILRSFCHSLAHASKDLFNSRHWCLTYFGRKGALESTKSQSSQPQEPSLNLRLLLAWIFRICMHIWQNVATWWNSGAPCIFLLEHLSQNDALLITFASFRPTYLILDLYPWLPRKQKRPVLWSCLVLCHNRDRKAHLWDQSGWTLRVGGECSAFISLCVGSLFWTKPVCIFFFFFTRKNGSSSRCQN